MKREWVRLLAGEAAVDHSILVGGGGADTVDEPLPYP